MKKNENTVQKTDVFKDAVEKTADLRGGFRKGLQALKGNSTKVATGNPGKLSGSVDIDECTKHIYPNDARWDYAIGYDNEAWFLEVHPANTSNVKEMVKKVQWLEKWLLGPGRKLCAIRKDKVHYWIPSGKVCILKTSPQYRSLAQHNLLITGNPLLVK